MSWCARLTEGYAGSDDWRSGLALCAIIARFRPDDNVCVMSDSFLQTVAIGWVFGAERFCDCVEQMTGHRPNMFWYLCWKYFAPSVMGGVFIFYCISYEPVK